jgi:RHS repeat-associated protein
MAPNSGEQTWSYDGAGRITGTTWLTGTTTLFTQTVTLDAAWQRTASSDSWGSSTYGYDTAGRLTSASYPDGSSEADQYDASGNRTVITGTTTLAGTNVITNTYDLADQLTGTASTQGNTTYSYDGNGNQTVSYGITGIVTNTYNDLEQLTNVVGPGTNVSYVYDGQGDRLRSYEQSGTTPVLYNDAQDLEGGLSDLVADGINDYTYLDPGTGEAPTAAYSVAVTRTSYLATDVLGSVRLATDPTGAVIGAGAYDAWGVSQPNLGGSGATQLAGLQAVSPFGYAGQYYDAGAGTYDMRAREYNPAQGRFTSEDPQSYAAQVPITTNPYEYAGDMVTGTTDPSGQGWVEQPAKSPDDLNEISLQANIGHEIGGLPQVGSAGFTTEYNVPIYTTHCAQPAPPTNVGILSLSADHTQGYFWDIEHFQAYTQQPGASALARGILTHLTLPLLQGTLVGWGAACGGKRIGNPTDGAACADVRPIRVTGVLPGPDFISFFQLHGPDTYALPVNGQNILAHVALYDGPPWDRVVAWNEPSQAGLILYDHTHLVPDCLHGSLAVQVACAELLFKSGPGMQAAEPAEGEPANGPHEEITPLEAQEADLLASQDESGQATLAEDLGETRKTSNTEDGCVGCFAAGTQVAEPGGNAPIERLEVGDTVLAENAANGKVESEPIQAVIDDGAKPIIELDLADGTSVKTTSTHYFWVDSGQDLSAPGWLQAGQLNPGDHLRTASGPDAVVLRVEWNVGDAEVYTLTVATDHTFFVGADQVLVHNCGPGQLKLPTGPSQQKLNKIAGDIFEQGVAQALRQDINHRKVTVLVKGKLINTEPDLLSPTLGVVDIKNVKNLSSTSQLQAQANYATQTSQPFSVIIGPATQTVSKPLQDAVTKSNGIIVRFDPKTDTFSKVTFIGNRVVP